MKQIIIICGFFLFTNCKNDLNKSIEVKVQDVLSTKVIESEIPNEIKTYIDSNSDFEMLAEKDLKLVKEQVQSSSILTYMKGDFNQNKIEDFAIILRYKRYKNDEYTNYNFPFLVIFNDYKNGVVPNVVYKTGDYAEEDIKTVIYDQFEEGIFSYLKKGNVCDKEVIDIVIPEKSSFYVFWNPRNKKYELLNYLDEDLCIKMNNEISSFLTDWAGNYSSKFLRIKEENGDPRAYATLNIDIKKEVINFRLDSYEENLEKELLILNNTTNELILVEKNDKNSKFTITKSGDKFELKSDLLNKIMGEDETYKIEKIE
jgi:hypothetical protein